MYLLILGVKPSIYTSTKSRFLENSSILKRCFGEFWFRKTVILILCRYLKRINTYKKINNNMFLKFALFVKDANNRRNLLNLPCLVEKRD